MDISILGLRPVPLPHLVYHRAVATVLAHGANLRITMIVAGHLGDRPGTFGQKAMTWRQHSLNT